ncbi:putative leader peptide [Streptomyces fildesensis]|uniref:Leader peptide n=1 Tax=Streptomyces fildesensis TaxID=375757 RepID=A0ABW8C9W9_9ACTN
MYAGPGMAAWRRHGRASAFLRRHIDLQRVSSALCRG